MNSTLVSKTLTVHFRLTLLYVCCMQNLYVCGRVLICGCSVFMQFSCHPWMWSSIAFSCGCLSVSACLSVCPVDALTCQSLDLETSILICRCIFTMARPGSYIKVFRSRSKSQKQKGHTSITKYRHSPVVCFQLTTVNGVVSEWVCRV